MTKCHKTTLVSKIPTYFSCYTSWLNPTPCTGSRASWQTEPSWSLAVGQATSGVPRSSVLGPSLYSSYISMTWASTSRWQWDYLPVALHSTRASTGDQCKVLPPRPPRCNNNNNRKCIEHFKQLKAIYSFLKEKHGMHKYSHKNV